MEFFGFEIHRKRTTSTEVYDELSADIRWCQDHIQKIENRLDANGFRDKKRTEDDAQIAEILRMGMQERTDKVNVWDMPNVEW